MDIELLRTFLEVSRTLHFGHAADKLFVTQSTVSARIRQLEAAIGAPLFTRARNNIRLTPSGRRLLGHAQAIVNTWNRARQEVTVDEDAGRPLAAGGVPSLWDVLLQDWIHDLHREMPEFSLRLEVHSEDMLLRQLHDASLDLALLLDAPQTPALSSERIATVSLMMVSTYRDLRAADALHRNYVLVDWGPSFALAHADHFPGIPPPVIRLPLGRLARDFLLEFGGTAYLAEPTVALELAGGQLFRVDEAPVIERAAYAVYPKVPGRTEALDRVLSRL